MKRIIPMLFVVALTLSTHACANSDNPGVTNNNTTSKVLTFTINGASYTASTVSGGYNAGNLTISGTNAGKTLNISATGLAGAGTYSLSMGNPNSAIATYIDGVEMYATGYLGGAGTITLTEASLTHVKGSFNFIAYTGAGTGAGKPIITVQNGVFDITVP